MVKSIRTRINNPLQLIAITGCLLLTCACSVQKAQKTLLASPSLKGAHIGIAVYNDTKQAWIDQYQSDHYFTPASNTKILATYVGLKYLGDSLPGFSIAEQADSLFLTPLGDPSFLHPDFSYQPVVDLIKSTRKQVVISIVDQKDKFDPFGDGWAWNDYAEDYQPERSRMPIYGNVVHFYQDKGKIEKRPAYFFKDLKIEDSLQKKAFTRMRTTNTFYPTLKNNSAKYYQLPFITYQTPMSVLYLSDTIHTVLPIVFMKDVIAKSSSIIKTVPTDSLLKIMMRRSDNFFAEQVLLMASEQLLGKMDDAAFIDTVLKTEFANLPQKMRWADGSGLSRYNLNTPENYVAILKSMQDQFGQARVTNIFETGGEGTLSAYFKNFPGELHAKTGSLGGQIALSGFIFTQKKQKLYFSVLVSNHMSPSSAGVRRAVETYLKKIASKN